MTEHPRPGEGEGRGRADAFALILCLLLVPGLWLLLGWRPSRLVSGYDAVGALAPMVQAIVDARGDPAALAYRPEVMGGVALRDTLGPQPLLLVPAALGFSVTAVLNLATFVTQALLAFFSQRALADLAVVMGFRRPSRLVALPTALMFVAFAPWVGWRVGYGHVTLLVGLLPFLAAFALAAAVAARSLNGFLLLAAGLTVALSLPFVGQQMVLYGVVFGAPAVAGLLWATPLPSWPLARLRPATLALCGGLLLAAPGYGPMLRHALSSDALRDLGGATMTWSYLTANPLDALTSLPWARPGTGIRAEIQLHESNLPVGPLVLLLLVLPARGRRIFAGLAVSAVLAAVLAANLRPASDLLLALVPPLRSFRAPTRALLPVLAVWPLLALAPLLSTPDASGADSSVGKRSRALWAAVGVGLFFGLLAAPPLLREIVGWLAAAAVVWRWKGSAPCAGPCLAALVVGLAGGSLGAFRERLLPFPDAEGLLAEARSQGEAARGAYPRLGRPLTRVSLDAERHDPERPSLGVNRAFAAGLSSLDGYAFPQRRFVALVRALRGEPYSPTALILRFGEAYAPSQVLFQLYDVAFAMEERPPFVRERGPTAGAAWFPATVVVDADLGATARALLAWGETTHAEARRTLRVVGDDPRLKGLRMSRSPACADARVDGLERMAGSAWAVDVHTEGDCPLVLATNYAETLEAWSPGGAGEERRLTTFPAYGALLAVEVPTGTSRIVIRPATWPSAATVLLAVLGAGLLAAALVDLRRRAGAAG